MAANPKDLYLYLFQLVVVAFLCMSLATLLPLWALIWGATANMRVVGVAFSFLVALALILSAAAIGDAKKLSAKNIESTRTRLQKLINDANYKLFLPSPDE